MKPVDAMLEQVKWEIVPPYDSRDGLPTVTHEGLLEIGGIRLRVYQLSSGQRVIEQEDFEKFLGALFCEAPTASG